MHTPCETLHNSDIHDRKPFWMKLECGAGAGGLQRRGHLL